jgi:hypothetical protein
MLNLVIGIKMYHRLITIITLLVFCVGQLFPLFPPQVLAQSIAPLLPPPGTMISITQPYAPVIIRGITIYPNNPLQFDFIIDAGEDHLAQAAFLAESTKLIKYFLASLTVPENQMWVNLSPYEKNRIVPQAFGETEMGRDLLAQDYLLKQLTASLMYPEEELGSRFWKKIYEEALERYGITDIPVDSFNKVWIVPDKAVVYVHGNNVFVAESHLKAMLESDYIASVSGESFNADGGQPAESRELSEDLIREIILPAIEKEVNEGKTFTALRQIYNASILAAWYKQNLKKSLLGQQYIDKNKTTGVDIEDKSEKFTIYNQYLEAFQQGVYNYIKEDYDPQSQEIISRKYFSGGAVVGVNVRELEIRTDRGMAASIENSMDKRRIQTVTWIGKNVGGDLKWVKNDESSLLWLPGVNSNGERPLSRLHLPGQEERMGSGLIKPRSVSEAEHRLAELGKGREVQEVMGDDVNRYSSTRKALVEIEGMDPEKVKAAREFILSRIAAMITDGVNFERFLASFVIALEKSVSGVEINKRVTLEDTGRIFSQINTPVQGIIEDHELLTKIIDNLEYLLHPDVYRLLTFDKNRRKQIIEVLTKVWGLSQTKEVKSLHRRLDLLISLLSQERGGKKRSEESETRALIKRILRETDTRLFGKTDLIKIKEDMLLWREAPKEYFNNVEEWMVNLWEEDDAARKREIEGKLADLSALTEDEFNSVIQAAKQIGSRAYYLGEMKVIKPFSEDRRFGLELEYRIDQELQIPKQDGFTNSDDNWISVHDSMEDFWALGAPASIHVHISRDGIIEESDSERALMRMIVAYEAVFRLLGSFEDLVLTYGTSPNLSNFFTGYPITKHQVYINKSDNKATIEFRFFGLPLNSGRDKFDYERLQAQVGLAMQMVETAKDRPEDFSLLAAGLPVRLGMNDELIDLRYLAKFADKLFKNNSDGKLDFIKLIGRSVDADGKISWRKEEKKSVSRIEVTDTLNEVQSEVDEARLRVLESQGWTVKDSEVEDAFRKEGLGFLYQLHKQSGRWDTNIYETLRSKAEQLKGKKDEPEKTELIQFLLSNIYSGATTEKEREFSSDLLREMNEQSLFNKTEDMLENIEDLDFQYTIRNYVLEALFKSSTGRSDEEIESLMQNVITSAEGIQDYLARNTFVKHVLPALLISSRNRSEEKIENLMQKTVNICAISHASVNFGRRYSRSDVEVPLYFRCLAGTV